MFKVFELPGSPARSGWGTSIPAFLRPKRVNGPPISICELFQVELPSFDNKLQGRFIAGHSE
jgi:hypothetical protein